MEANSLPMQALVVAHACYGHNSFFKGNYLFRQWTDADAIIDYMVFARNFVLDCEERDGIEAVEETLDACHALRDFAVSRLNCNPGSRCSISPCETSRMNPSSPSTCRRD